jgi:hypothetical protein
MKPTPKLLKLSSAVYHHLLLLYPRSFRDAYSLPMMLLFRDLCRDAYMRGGSTRLIWFWCFVLGDSVKSAGREHAILLKRDWEMTSRNRLLVLGIIAVALPVLVLQAWDSNVFDTSPIIMLLVGLAIGIPLLASMLGLKPEVLAAAGASSLLLLFVVRFASPVRLGSDLFTILPLLGVILYLSYQKQQGSKQTS